jgi:hypothetical protein
MFRTSTFLRFVLLVDAATCFATGLLMMFGSGTLAQVSGLPETLVRYAGLSLLPFAMFLVFLATRQLSSRSLVWAASVLNVLWTADSLLLLATGWVAPTQLGYVLVIAQALGVGILAGLEYVGMRKSMVAAVV